MSNSDYSELVERLTMFAYKAINNKRFPQVIKDGNEAAEAITTLQRQLAEANQDAKRYQWLSKQNSYGARGNVTEVIVHAPNFERREDGRVLSGYQLDKHIDAAIASAEA